MRLAISNNRWAILLGLLVTSMFLDAMIAQSYGANARLEFAALLVSISILMGLVFAVQHSPLVDTLGFVFLGFYGTVAALNIFFDAHWINKIMLSLSTVILVGGVVITFLQLIKPMSSDREKLFSAVFGYFLTATLWAYLFLRIELVQPESLNLPEGESANFTTYLYYSLVTISTLGYGEITPVLPIPRILAALEACFGTLYVAVLIGQIVGRFRS
ncbi:MAG: ion channel [Pseudomonadota bacterium]